MGNVAVEKGKHQIVLTFHGIGTPHRRVPGREIPFWFPEQRFIDIVDKVAELRSMGDDIQITLDDGNASDISIGAPILLSRNLSAQFFVLTGRLGNPHYLTGRDVEALVEMGMSVGLHGRDHVDWQRLNPTDLENETRVSRAVLEEILRVPVQDVSIPFGSYNRRVITHLKSLEFQTIYTSDSGPTRPGNRVKSRTTLRSDMTEESVRGILEGRQSIKERVRRTIKMMYLN